MKGSTLLVVVTLVALIVCIVVGCGKKDEEGAGGAGGEGGAAKAKTGPGGPGAKGAPGAPGAKGAPGGEEAGAGPAKGAPGAKGGPGAEAKGGPGAKGGPAGAKGGPAAAGAEKGGAAEQDTGPKMTPEEIKVALADAKVYKDVGNMDKALQVVTDVIKSDPKNLDANWMAAWILAEKNDTALAVGQFERVLKLGLKGDRANEAEAAIKRLKARES